MAESEVTKEISAEKQVNKKILEQTMSFLYAIGK
jgi:hypothetical protein